MKKAGLKLLIIAMVILAACTALASPAYNVSIDTGMMGLNGSSGYIYFQYIPYNGNESEAVVSDFAGGVLSPDATMSGSVSGILPGEVRLSWTSGLNDYNHGITFGNRLSFDLDLANTGSFVPYSGSTFSFGLFADAEGLIPLASYDGILFTADLDSSGIISFDIMNPHTNATPTPIPAAAWLFLTGMAGSIIMKRRAGKEF